MTSEGNLRGNLHGSNSLIDAKGLSRGRPWLLSSNRKLRHLQGISLRNLTLSRSSNRSRGKTIDDESLPYALKSSAKALAQQEAPKLEHAKSSSNLQSSHFQNQYFNDSTSLWEDGHMEQARPLGKLRRRSTLNWTNSTPRVRQKKLEDVIASKLADTWFSLHCSGYEEPVYISETIEKVMNPSFRFFDLNSWGPSVSRQDELTIKFWVRTDAMEQYSLLLELSLNFQSLQFFGKELENLRHPLPPNCIIFHLSDGIYTNITGSAANKPVSLGASQLPKVLAPDIAYTSSFDALMRLSNLDVCIQDALDTRERLTSQINAILQLNKGDLATVNSVPQSRASLQSTQHYVSITQKQVMIAESSREELRNSIRVRLEAMKIGSLAQEKAVSQLAASENSLMTWMSLREATIGESQGQLRRICEDFQRIYPIEPVEGKALSFTICGLPLANANSKSTISASEEATAAALGMVAHLVYLLSHYLSTPLPYPILAHSSTSRINDPITRTVPSAQRTFPLYQKGQAQYRFEYGVFLLNTNIGLLMSKQGLRMVDQRHTLPNLKYLLYVLTAGKGELPARKMGGIRGLGESSSRDSSIPREPEDSPIGGDEVSRAAQRQPGKTSEALEGSSRPLSDLSRLNPDGIINLEDNKGSLNGSAQGKEQVLKPSQ